MTTSSDTNTSPEVAAGEHSPPASAPAHLRGLPTWAILSIVAAAFFLGTLSFGLSWLQGRAAMQLLAFGTEDVATLTAIAGLSTDTLNEALIVHALNAMVHLKGISNYQSLGVLAIGAGSAFLAIGFALFLIGADGAFKLQYVGQGSNKLVLYATTPGLLCFVMSAVLIHVGATRRHEMELGAYQSVREASVEAPTALPPMALAHQPVPTQLLADYCIDRALPRDLNRPTNGSVSIGGGRARAISPRGNTWINGSTLRVAFLDGNQAVRQIARAAAEEWANYANIKFEFVTDASRADVRITFAEQGRWSYLGNSARSVPHGEPTMSLGLIGPASHSVSLHQFGHALGLSHEHVAVAGGLRWDMDALMRVYTGPPNRWTGDQVRRLVVLRYDLDQMNGTEVDPESIMRLPIPAGMASNSAATSWKAELSARDKALIASPRFYPSLTVVPAPAASR